MNKLALVFLLLSSCALGTDAKSAQSLVNIHVSATRMVPGGPVSGMFQLLTVTIEGRKYEIESIASVNALLALGDYKAKLVKDEHPITSDSWQVYEIQLPGGKTRKFVIVGESE
jgi:hypothetical protein